MELGILFQLMAGDVYKRQDGNKGSIMILCGIRVKVPSVRKMGSFKPIQYGERKIYMFAGTLPLLTKIL